MSNLIQTKERLSSTKSTQKVIKAMELVASSKIKKAKEKALNNQAYFQQISAIMQCVFTYEDLIYHLHLEECQDQTLIIAITSDMGLCGAYNNNIIKTIHELNQKYPHHLNIMLGNKGINKLAYEQVKLYDQINDFAHQDAFELANRLTKQIIDLYLQKQINKVLVVYTKFVNPIVQETSVIDLLAFDRLESDNKYNYELIVDGDKQVIFEDLLIQYVTSVIYYAILNSIASEYAARRNSMEAANNNSLEIIEQLNLEMNRIRQAMITQEIAEIIGGKEALDKE